MVEATKGHIRASELIDALWDDGEIGPKLQAIAKQKWPEVKVTSEKYAPIVAPLQSKIEKLEKDLATEREARAKEATDREERQIRSTIESRISEAAKEFSLTEAGVKMLHEHMIANNTLDAKGAAAYIVAKAPPQNVRGPTVGPQSYDPYFGLKEGDEMRKSLHRDPERFRDGEIEKFLSDPDRYLREYQGVGL